MTKPKADLADQTWDGRWVADRLGVTVDTTSSAFGVTLDGVIGLALRRNPRRAHLLVSRVLGKHVPADPRLVYGVGLLLGGLVRDLLAGEPRAPEHVGDRLRIALSPEHPQRDTALNGFPDLVRQSCGRPAPPAVVLGYAETATALGQAVADACETAAYLHSTRRSVAGIAPLSGFLEEHSHAARHLLLPTEHSILLNELPLVLVDDELTTGNTALNTIACLHALRPRARYVIATLVDARSEADRLRMKHTAADLGTTIDVVAMSTGRVHAPDDAPRQAERLVADLWQDASPAPRLDRPGPRPGHIRQVDIGWPAGLPESGRHGFLPDDRRELENVLDLIVDRLVEELPPDRRHVHVLGVEEFMYVPLRIADRLAERLSHEGVQVRFSTTTRSPVLAVDHPEYAIRHRLSFPAYDDPASDSPDDTVRFAYNLDGAADTLVVVLDRDSEALAGPGGMLDVLRTAADRILVTSVGRAA